MWVGIICDMPSGKLMWISAVQGIEKTTKVAWSALVYVW